MVYIAGGSVQEKKPWSIQRIMGFFWGIIAFIIYFFRSLVGLESGPRGNGRGGSSGGGSGGGPKRIGRITTMEDCSMPGGG